MRMLEIDYGGARPVEGYGPGFFRIGGEVRRGPVLLLGAEILAWDGPGDLAPLAAVAGRIDLLLLGTGAEIARPTPALAAAAAAGGYGVEAMATPAACRTWNVLLAEGRRVAAALVPV